MEDNFPKDLAALQYLLVAPNLIVIVRQIALQNEVSNSSRLI